MRTAFVIGLVLVVSSLGCDELFEGAMVESPSVTLAPAAGNDALADYGYWSNDDVYGTIWTPYDSNVVPYATLHRGRWVTRDGRWCWVPPDDRFAQRWLSPTHGSW